ncbi:hypothetical protein V6N13_117903 [Hibiscus sabdariffa]
MGLQPYIGRAPETNSMSVSRIENVEMLSPYEGKGSFQLLGLRVLTKLVLISQLTQIKIWEKRKVNQLHFQHNSRERVVLADSLAKSGLHRGFFFFIVLRQHP